MARARATGIVLIQNFESRLQGDILAVEAAVPLSPPCPRCFSMVVGLNEAIRYLITA
jgi:hypothetical protein